MAACQLPHCITALHFAFSLSPKQDRGLPEDKDLQLFKLHSRDLYKWRGHHPMLMVSGDQELLSLLLFFYLSAWGSAPPHPPTPTPTISLWKSAMAGTRDYGLWNRVGRIFSKLCSSGGIICKPSLDGWGRRIINARPAWTTQQEPLFVTNKPCSPKGKISILTQND